MQEAFDIQLDSIAPIGSSQDRQLDSQTQIPHPQLIADSSKIELLVLDIDGTIAGLSNDVRLPVKQAIEAAQSRGIKVAIATGRMYRSALRFHRAIGADLPILAYQGAWIQDPATQQIHRHLPVPNSIARQLLDYFEQPELLPLITVHFYLDDRLYVRQLTSETQYYAERSGVEPTPVGDLRQLLVVDGEREPHLTKVLAMSDDPTLIGKLLADLRSRYSGSELYLTTSVPTFLEATNPLVNKGTAVRYLAEEVLGLQAANVMAVGDNFNDLEMLEYAGVGVAMGDAPADVKAIAQWSAPSVEEDGAAKAIETLLLNR
jgi:Cof subfamily protein (haloacid dehalogenase superfamily)